MGEHKSKWMASMVEKHGSEEAVREFMRQASNKSKRNSGGTGGFAKMQREDPERLKQISIKGGKGNARNT